MSTVAQLELDAVSLEAGDHVTIPIHIRNDGPLVEEYHLEVIGIPSSWSSIDAPVFTLNPDRSATAVLDLHPPRSSDAMAGQIRFGVQVTPLEHPDERVVPEAVIEVLPFLETTAELVPRTSRGRSGARHQVAVDNRGNVEVSALVRAEDPTGLLHSTTSPSSVTVLPGRAHFVDVRVRPVTRLWRGTPRTVPFTVTVSPQNSTPVELQGTHLQEPVLAPWLGKALLALLVTLLALAALWFWVLRPTIAVAARDAVAVPVSDASANAAAAKQAASDAKQDSAGASGAAAKAGGAAAQATTAADKAQAIVSPSLPVTRLANYSQRLSVTQAGGLTHTDPWIIGDKQSFALTDLVLENTQGDSGLLTIAIDDRVIITQALESFRTTDYHFVTPFSADAGSKILLTVRCNKPGAPPDTTPVPTTCLNSVTLGGVMSTTS